MVQAERSPKKGYSSPLVWLERVSPAGTVEIEVLGGNDHFCEWAAAEAEGKGGEAIRRMCAFERFGFMKKFGSRAGFADMLGWSGIKGTVLCGAA